MVCNLFSPTIFGEANFAENFREWTKAKSLNNSIFDCQNTPVLVDYIPLNGQ